MKANLITNADGRVVSLVVRLSRRNVLAFLHKLDEPGSARTIYNGDVVVNGSRPDEVVSLITIADQDEEHYIDREAGAMEEKTEAFIKARGK